MRDGVKDELQDHVYALHELNNQNNAANVALEYLWAGERARDVRQDRSVAALYPSVKDFKDKLFQVSITSQRTLASPSETSNRSSSRSTSSRTDTCIALGNFKDKLFQVSITSQRTLASLSETSRRSSSR